MHQLHMTSLFLGGLIQVDLRMTKAEPEQLDVEATFARSHELQIAQLVQGLTVQVLHFE